jgi:uncharacterized membrane protein YfcA
MIEHWLALPVGILIASAASAVGIGGGILWMPFFLIIMKLGPETAVLTSLIIQTAGMGSATVTYWRKDYIDRRLAFFLMGVTIPGVVAGALITTKIQASHMQLALGLLTLTTAFLFVSVNHNYLDHGGIRVPMQTARRYGGLVSLMSVASGMLSVSIGEWLIPLMRSKMSLRMNFAVASSIATIFGTCLIGLGVHLLLGHQAHLEAVLWAIPGVLIGGQLGPRITARISERVLKEVFIFLLTLIGIHLMYNSY